MIYFHGSYLSERLLATDGVLECLCSFEMQPFVRESVGAPGRVTHCALDNYEKHAEHVHLKCPDSSGGAWKETGEVFVST